VAAIAGFGAAAAAATRQADADRIAALRDRIEAAIKAAVPEAVIFGETVQRLPNTTLFAVPGMKAETAIIVFDLNGIAVSSGSACSSGKVQASHVLAAMGVEPILAQGAVRLSLGWSTSERDVEILLAALTKVSSSLLKRHENSRLNSGLAA
jgi:cysteine desulfurase